MMCPLAASGWTGVFLSFSCSSRHLKPLSLILKWSRAPLSFLHCSLYYCLYSKYFSNPREQVITHWHTEHESTPLDQRAALLSCIAACAQKSYLFNNLVMGEHMLQSVKRQKHKSVTRVEQKPEVMCNCTQVVRAYLGSNIGIVPLYPGDMRLALGGVWTEQLPWVTQNMLGFCNRYISPPLL